MKSEQQEVLDAFFPPEEKIELLSEYLIQRGDGNFDSHCRVHRLIDAFGQKAALKQFSKRDCDYLSTVLLKEKLVEYDTARIFEKSRHKSKLEKLHTAISKNDLRKLRETIQLLPFSNELKFLFEFESECVVIANGERSKPIAGDVERKGYLLRQIKGFMGPSDFYDYCAYIRLLEDAGTKKKYKGFLSEYANDYFLKFRGFQKQGDLWINMSLVYAVGMKLYALANESHAFSPDVRKNKISKSKIFELIAQFINDLILVRYGRRPTITAKSMRTNILDLPHKDGKALYEKLF